MLPGQKEIVIPFCVNERKYNAVGHLEEGKTSTNGYEMLLLCGAIGDEDGVYLENEFKTWPTELGDFRLATGRRDPQNKRNARFFRKGENNKVIPYWGCLGYEWTNIVLVITRVL